MNGCLRQILRSYFRLKLINYLLLARVSKSRYSLEKTLRWRTIMGILNNKGNAGGLAMLILLSTSMILSAVISATPIFAAKHHSKDCQGDKNCNVSKSIQTTSIVSCKSNGKESTNSSEKSGSTSCENQTNTTGSLNATAFKKLTGIFG
jgi:hypothetical protein